MAEFAEVVPASPVINPQDADTPTVPPLKQVGCAPSSPHHLNDVSPTGAQCLQPKRLNVNSVVYKTDNVGYCDERKGVPDECGSHGPGSPATVVRNCASSKCDVANGNSEAPSGAQVRVCDACPHCDDVCVWASCASCNAKEEALRERNGGKLVAPPSRAKFTMCQVARHNTEHDVWLVAHGAVYDATEFLKEHPGGVQSIIRHAGQDCTRDFDFHSSAARALWNDLRIGKLVACGKDGVTSCAIM